MKRENKEVFVNVFSIVLSILGVLFITLQTNWIVTVSLVCLLWGNNVQIRLSLVSSLRELSKKLEKSN